MEDSSRARRETMGRDWKEWYIYAYIDSIDA
jgi:hypothetical protein